MLRRSVRARSIYIRCADTRRFQVREYPGENLGVDVLATLSLFCPAIIYPRFQLSDFVPHSSRFGMMAPDQLYPGIVSYLPVVLIRDITPVSPSKAQAHLGQL